MVVFIVGIMLFIGLVITHEMGHFWAARRNGVDVEEFGIFFPPRLWKRRMKKGWDFTINALPLGGFVKLKGEHDSDTAKGSFGAASDWQKSKIMLAGVAVNLLTAYLIFTVLALIGMPKVIDGQYTVASDTKVAKHSVYVGYVEPGSPAEKAGLQEHDQVIAISSGGKTVQLREQPLSGITKSFAGEPVTITYERNGVEHQVTTTLRDTSTVQASQKTDEPKGYLGVSPQELIVQRSTWSAPVVAFGLTVQFTKLTLQGLWHAIQGLFGIIAGAITGNSQARVHAQTEASNQVSGPLGIFFILKGGSALGAIFMLFIIAILSLTLAIMNVLPIPALDGGRLYMMLLSRLTKQKRLTPKVEETIVGASFMLLIALVILITVVDVKRFF